MEGATGKRGEDSREFEIVDGLKSKPKPPPPSSNISSTKDQTKEKQLTLNPVLTQPRPAVSPQGDNETKDLVSDQASHRGDETSTADKKNPMANISQALGHLWTWAKEKGAKLKEIRNKKGEVRQPTSEPPEIPFKARLEKFKQALKSDRKIDKKFVCQHAFLYGSPEASGYRSLLWKLLLGYLPYDRDEWENVIKKKRALYDEWVLELVTNPYKIIFEKKKEEEQGKGGESTETKPSTLKMQSVDEMEDPLRQDPTSKWDQYFKDETLREEIHKDVMRTYSSFSFFMQRVHNPDADPKSETPVATVSPKGESKTKENYSPSKDETHHDVIQRILFIYAKLNPGVRYVQGMNEILAPIYFTFAKDSDEDFRVHAEADAFFCFSNLMIEVRDRFDRTLDCTSAGIIAAVKDLNDLLEKVDKKLHVHLRKLNIDPRFYAFRWLTLLLSQEFELPDTLRLWDSLFADEKRFDYLTYCCVSMLLIYREKLLKGGFAEGLRLLQDYPSTDLHEILAQATTLNLRTKFKFEQSDGQQLVMPIDLDAHLGLNVRRKGKR